MLGRPAALQRCDKGACQEDHYDKESTGEEDDSCGTVEPMELCACWEEYKDGHCGEESGDNKGGG